MCGVVGCCVVWWGVAWCGGVLWGVVGCCVRVGDVGGVDVWCERVVLAVWVGGVGGVGG